MFGFHVDRISVPDHSYPCTVMQCRWDGGVSQRKYLFECIKHLLELSIPFSDLYALLNVNKHVIIIIVVKFICRESFATATSRAMKL